MTVYGSNFSARTAVSINGVKATITANVGSSLIDATHMTVAIPASDVTVGGSASVAAINPGANPSGTITIAIN